MTDGKTAAETPAGKPTPTDGATAFDAPSARFHDGRTGPRRALHGRSARRLTPQGTAVAVVVAFVALVGLETGVYLFARSKGVNITGDEPHYLILARALTHFSPHVLWAYERDLRTHAIYPWPPGATIHTPGLLHAYAGPHGVVSAHALGISVLMMPFMAVGGKNLALVGFFGVEVVGLLYLHQRASWLLGLTRGARVVFAVALAGPAVLLAATQIYPDFLSGIFAACALLEVAVIERRRTVSALSVAVVAATAAYLPWLHIKDILLGGVAVAAFAVVAVRLRAWRPLVVVAVVVSVSWGLEAAYDLYYFGHLLGLPQPAPTLTRQGVTQTMALVFGREQGLFVQAPVAVLGLAGMWLARRRSPVAIVATILGAGAIVGLNGSYLEDPFGGTVLQGRFEWTAVPLLVVFTACTLAELQRRRVRLGVVGGAVGGLWVLQAVPLLADHHHYYNFFPAPPWDPALYGGWWWWADRLLPEFSQPQRVFGAPWYALLFEVVLLAVALAAVLRLASPRHVARRPAATSTGLAVVAVVVLVAIAPTTLPPRPLTWTGSDLGGVLTARVGTPVSRSPIPLQGVGAGQFTATFRYTLSGATGGEVSLFCAGPDPAVVQRSKRELVAGTHQVQETVSCGTAVIELGLRAGGGSQLVPVSLSLAKVRA
ncbi:MAG: hypothetical protein M0007_06960 [Actinomycetota bacterium]|nr:hypothetical protein [Actinomycetota bacterium]